MSYVLLFATCDDNDNDDDHDDDDDHDELMA